jgi:hypothetical protein
MLLALNWRTDFEEVRDPEVGGLGAGYSEADVDGRVDERTTGVTRFEVGAVEDGGFNAGGRGGDVVDLSGDNCVSRV